MIPFGSHGSFILYLFLISVTVHPTLSNLWFSPRRYQPEPVKRASQAPANTFIATVSLVLFSLLLPLSLLTFMFHSGGLFPFFLQPFLLHRKHLGWISRILLITLMVFVFGTTSHRQFSASCQKLMSKVHAGCDIRGKNRSVSTSAETSPRAYFSLHKPSKFAHGSHLSF